MNALLDAFWRATAYCLHPRVILWSLLPLAAMVAIALGLGWAYWDRAIDAVFLWLESSQMLASAGKWLQDMGLGSLRTVVAPLIVVFAVTPLVVLLVLLLVATLMMPAMVSLVARRRFPMLVRHQGGSFLGGLAWAIGSLLMALAALAITVPLWLVPPLILVVPPLIWGWMTYRVMTYDALAEHATREERRALVRQHRFRLLGMGVATGYLGAAPSVVWASGWFFAAAFLFLVPVAIWIYTLVFAFSSLWFSHYCLAALEKMRAEAAAASAATTPQVVDAEVVDAAPVSGAGTPSPLALRHDSDS